MDVVFRSKEGVTGKKGEEKLISLISVSLRLHLLTQELNKKILFILLFVRDYILMTDGNEFNDFGNVYRVAALKKFI